MHYLLSISNAILCSANEGRTVRIPNEPPSGMRITTDFLRSCALAELTLLTSFSENSLAARADIESASIPLTNQCIVAVLASLARLRTKFFVAFIKREKKELNFGLFCWQAFSLMRKHGRFLTHCFREGTFKKNFCLGSAYLLGETLPYWVSLLSSGSFYSSRRGIRMALQWIVRVDNCFSGKTVHQIYGSSPKCSPVSK